MTAAVKPSREELLKQIRLRIKNARGAIESGQITDKDVHGSLTKALEMIDRLAAKPADDEEEITPEMAIAGRKALVVIADRMEEAKLLAVSSIDFWQRVGHEPANEIYRAMAESAPVRLTANRPADEVQRQLDRANKIIAWMMPYIGTMCPPQNGLFELNNHCFENRVVPNFDDETKGRPVTQSGILPNTAALSTTGEPKR